MQHRAHRNVPGRHRRTATLPSHRAPSTPITEKGRYAVAAALVAGVGVAGVAAATDGASSPASAQTRTQITALSSGAPAALPLASASESAAPQQATTGAVTTGAVTPGTATTGAVTTGAVTPGTAAAGAAMAGTAMPGSVATAGVQAAGARPAAGIASVGGTGSSPAGTAFAPQARKAKPQPLWANPMPEGAVTSCFGQRWGRLHAGVDLAAPDGTPIRAAGAGTVVAAGPAEGYGNAVLIDHGNGYLTHYGHMSAITVKLGQHVAAGDQVGNEGSTGHSTGPHLHFEVHQGTYKNPIEPTQWMHDHGVDIPSCVTFTD